MNVGLQDGLLEQKHMDAIGSAVWLFMWLVRRQTKDGKVLGGKPLAYADFSEHFPGVHRITYNKWLKRLEAYGYISLIRTPRGYSVSVAKNKKWSGDVAEKQHH